MYCIFSLFKCLLPVTLCNPVTAAAFAAGVLVLRTTIDAAVKVALYFRDAHYLSNATAVSI